MDTKKPRPFEPWLFAVFFLIKTTPRARRCSSKNKNKIRSCAWLVRVDCHHCASLRRSGRGHAERLNVRPAKC
jgi:hypothetical protein